MSKTNKIGDTKHKSLSRCREWSSSYIIQVGTNQCRIDMWQRSSRNRFALLGRSREAPSIYLSLSTVVRATLYVLLPPLNPGLMGVAHDAETAGREDRHGSLVAGREGLHLCMFCFSSSWVANLTCCVGTQGEGVLPVVQKYKRGREGMVVCGPHVATLLNRTPIVEW